MRSRLRSRSLGSGRLHDTLKHRYMVKVLEGGILKGAVIVEASSPEETRAILRQRYHGAPPANATLEIARMGRTNKTTLPA